MEERRRRGRTGRGKGQGTYNKLRVEEKPLAHASVGGKGSASSRSPCRKTGERAGAGEGVEIGNTREPGAICAATPCSPAVPLPRPTPLLLADGSRRRPCASARLSVSEHDRTPKGWRQFFFSEKRARTPPAARNAAATKVKVAPSCNSRPPFRRLSLPWACARAGAMPACPRPRGLSRGLPPVSSSRAPLVRCRFAFYLGIPSDRGSTASLSRAAARDCSVTKSALFRVSGSARALDRDGRRVAPAPGQSGKSCRVFRCEKGRRDTTTRVEKAVAEKPSGGETGLVPRPRSGRTVLRTSLRFLCSPLPIPCDF